jgi:hypothetical protein
VGAARISISRQGAFARLHLSQLRNRVQNENFFILELEELDAKDWIRAAGMNRGRNEQRVGVLSEGQAGC